MGLLWTLTASFLGFEVFLIFLFIIPFLSAKKWKRIFQFRIFALISDYMIYLVFGLAIMFADSVSKLRKCNKELENIDKHPNFANAEFLELTRLNLFLAQRNFYISGFSLLFWLVLTRLVKLITAHGQLQLDYEEITKKGQVSSSTEKTALKSPNKAQIKSEENGPTLVGVQIELDKAKKSLKFTNSQLKTKLGELEAMKKQAEATQREYDRLLKETKGETSKKVN